MIDIAINSTISFNHISFDSNDKLKNFRNGNDLLLVYLFNHNTDAITPTTVIQTIKDYYKYSSNENSQIVKVGNSDYSDFSKANDSYFALGVYTDNIDGRHYLYGDTKLQFIIWLMMTMKMTV